VVDYWVQKNTYHVACSNAANVLNLSFPLQARLRHGCCKRINLEDRKECSLGQVFQHKNGPSQSTGQQSWVQTRSSMTPKDCASGLPACRRYQRQPGEIRQDPRSKSQPPHWRGMGNGTNGNKDWGYWHLFDRVNCKRKRSDAPLDPLDISSHLGGWFERRSPASTLSNSHLAGVEQVIFWRHWAATSDNEWSERHQTSLGQNLAVTADRKRRRNYCLYRRYCSRDCAS
jgi:hypothetical protein